LIDVSPARQVIDIYGRVTGDKEAKSVNQSLSTVDGYLRQAQEFYRNISRKNLPGTLRQIQSILGQLGIISPRSYPRTINDVLSGANMPDGTATTPGQIYAQQQMVIDTANSDQFWIYTDSVLGDGEQEGQSHLQMMNETSLASAEASLNGQQSSTSQSEKALQNAQLAQSASESVERLSAQAQQRSISQDVFKDIAAQHSQLAKSNSAMANQLATLSDQQAIAAGQLSALATQSQVSNEHLSELRVGQSIGNVQLHDIFNTQRHANQMTVMERQKNAQLSMGATDAIYLPGLFSGQAAPQ